jgi:hypothetical protein
MNSIPNSIPRGQSIYPVLISSSLTYILYLPITLLPINLTIEKAEFLAYAFLRLATTQISDRYSKQTQQSQSTKYNVSNPSFLAVPTTITVDISAGHPLPLYLIPRHTCLKPVPSCSPHNYKDRYQRMVSFPLHLPPTILQPQRRNGTMHAGVSELSTHYRSRKLASVTFLGR